MDDPSSVPQDRIVCIEHPCIIRDVDQGVKSLGGEHHLQKVGHLSHCNLCLSCFCSLLIGNSFQLLLPPGETPEAVVSLRPKDPLAKKLIAREAYVNNLLLRFVVPKKTGRKRKRGSNDPFISSGKSSITSTTIDSDERAPLDGKGMLRRLRDNQDRYVVEPVGVIHESHRFRTLPDFQLRAGNVPIFKDIARNLLDPTITSIKRFKPDDAIGADGPVSITAPPQFTQFAQPVNYQYEQNPAIATVTDEQGNKTTINTQAPRKRDMYAVPADVDTVPQGPPSSLPRLETTSKYMQQAAKNVVAMLEQRPIVTKRVAFNICDFGSETLYKDATQYAGYSFRAGPWRDALIKYGLDPRKDPSYRRYQTLTFQLSTKDTQLEAARKQPGGSSHWARGERQRKDESTVPNKPASHIFDGQSLSTNGKIWQVCDITDPQLLPLIDNLDVRAACDPQIWGWYHNGTLAVLRVIMRDKIVGMLAAGQDAVAGAVDAAHDAAVYAELVSRLPTRIDADTVEQTYLTHLSGGARSEKLQELTTLIRQLAKSGTTNKSGGMVLTGTRRGGKGVVKEDREEDAEGEVGDGDGDGDDDEDDGNGEGEDADGHDDAMVDVLSPERQVVTGGVFEAPDEGGGG